MAEQCKISAAMHAISLSEERSYVLKVDGYSRVKALLKNGQRVISTPFSVGGHDWIVRYYPHGSHEDSEDFISLYLELKSADAEDVKAKFTFSVLDENGEPVPSYSCDNWGYHNVIKKADLEASAHIRDDCLTIRCDVTVIHSEETRVPPSDLHHHLGDLLMNKDAADLTFQVGGQTFSALTAELLGAMKESFAASPIEICDMEADVFKSLLHFIYTDSIPSVLDVVMAGHLLVAADRYNIVRLKLICEEKLCNHIDSSMVATSLVLSEQHGFHRLKEACLQFLASPSNLEAMVASDGYEHLKSSCPSVLKEVISRILPAELKVAKDIIMAMWK
ncbi:BTB/POZ and MATH domain-containing protein 3-like [Triticum aestivum]|uniref:Speckle-type POZ protein-like protein n=1 Tax=Aegilops tauschii TaxID=37682 RepID=M8AID0_AEGTA|nr:BTB/POZ and MATH domain-containing protein 3-like [Triticum aestivum]